MCVIKKAKWFIENGISVFSDASGGRYINSFPEIETMKSEIFSKGTGSFTEDKSNFVNDRKMIASDVRKVLSEI